MLLVQIEGYFVKDQIFQLKTLYSNYKIKFYSYIVEVSFLEELEINIHTDFDVLEYEGKLNFSLNHFELSVNTRCYQPFYIFL